MKTKKDLSFAEIDQILKKIVLSVSKHQSSIREDLYQDAWVSFLELQDDINLRLMKLAIRRDLLNIIKRGKYEQ